MSTALKRYTVDEYLALEEKSEVKHEYFDGEIFAMAGGTPTPALLAMTLMSPNGLASLWASLAKLPLST